MIDLDKLEQIARDADQSEWGNDQPLFPNGNNVWFIQMCPNLSIAAPSPDEPNVKHVTAFNPAVALEMIAELRELRHRLAAQKIGVIEK